LGIFPLFPFVGNVMGPVLSQMQHGLKERVQSR
jgi:hypothetical protein